ncbi:MAG: NADH-quinone oxidoreductase subunit H [Candidatus Limnocylindrales bacterium]
MRPYVAVEVGLIASALTLIAGIYLLAVLDRWIGSAVAGAPLRLSAILSGPVRTAAALLLQQRRTTERPDTHGWAVAPALFFGLAALALVMVPLGPNLVVADPATGFVIFSAAIAFVMIAVFLHGWSPNSTFALHGAYRYGAQALSFQIPFLLAMLATALPAQSLSIVDIVNSQETLWNVVREPMGLPIYLVVGLGVSFWGPLNLSDAPDLAGGTSVEDSGIGRLLWMVARAAMLVAVAAMGAAGFLGGWWGPLLPGPVWVILKTVVLLIAFVAAGHLLARIRIERFVLVSWALLIPLALLNVFVSGAFLL